MKSPLISKCHGHGCSRKDECLRHTIPPLKKWQHYILMQVAIPDTSKCNYFISNESYNKTGVIENLSRESEEGTPEATIKKRRGRPKKEK